MKPSVIIQVHNLHTRFGDMVVHEGLDLEVHRGEILAVVGGSGTGKSTLLREIILLERPAAGSIHIFDQDILAQSSEQLLWLRQRCGVMFQNGALFSSLTVSENVALPIREHTALRGRLLHEIVALKLSLVGLPANAGAKYPAQLSGGMIKRAAVARALALDPDILFLDEPTAGLDPIGAGALDELILQLRELLGLTVFIVTHDLDTLWKITHRVAVLAEKKVLIAAPVKALTNHPHPWLRQYFHGPRGRAAAQ